MKRIFTALITLLFFTQICSASNIEILPTMQSKSNIQDRAWVGTFQIVWNDLMDKLVFGEVRFPDGTPDIVYELNKQEITTDDIEDNCYYKYFGRVTKNTKKTIENAIKNKFNETSDILKQLDLNPDKEKYLIYAMLKKDFKFKHAFDKLGKSKFRDTQAEFFGIDSHSDKKLYNNVRVLFYNSNSDYAVMLYTVNGDEVYLYKTQNTKPFNCIYEDMLKKEIAYNGKTFFTNRDKLKVPNIKFSEEKTFDELAGKRIKGTRFQIDKAIETIKFDMNNEGVKLKSEAAIMVGLTSAGPQQMEIPRYFYYDDTFVMFLKEKGKSNPYFALRVHDIAKFQDTKK